MVSLPETSYMAAVAWRRAAWVFAAYLVGASLLLGVTLTMQGGRPLAEFGAQHAIASVVALSVFRVIAARVAVAAVVVALVAGTHREGTPQSPWWSLGVAPAAAPVAVALTCLASAVTLATFFGVPLSAWWHDTCRFLKLTDGVLGLVRVVTYSVALAPLATWGLPVLNGRMRSLLGKLALACLVAGVTMGVVDFAFSLWLDTRIG
jgi:ABC-type transporter Mla maintaining outer membrane lipid asymmetry permease subunit MlaE